MGTSWFHTMRDNKICPVGWFHKIRKPDGDLMLAKIGVMRGRCTAACEFNTNRKETHR